MNQALAYLGLTLFAALPPVVLLARYRLGKAMPWRVAVFIIAVVGWFLVNFANYFYGEYACEPIHGVLNPPQEALARCTSDGASNAFALLFGWLYALLYSTPFFLLFALCAWLRRRRIHTHAA
jgi:hypothetical protein